MADNVIVSGRPPQANQQGQEISDKLTTLTTTQSNTLAGYQCQEVDDYTTTSVTYVGYMKTDGSWLIKKLDETGNFMTIRFANVSNNATLTTYALAWASRTTATYNYLNILSSV